MEDGRTGQKVNVWRVANGYIITLMDANDSPVECRVEQFSRYGSSGEVGKAIEEMLGGDPLRKEADAEYRARKADEDLKFLAQEAEPKST